MDPRYAVEVSEETFLEKYVPGENLTEDQLAKIGDFSHVPVNATLERKIYHPLFSPIERMYEVTGLPYTCRATGDHPESGMDDMKLDGCSYPTRDVPIVNGDRKIYDLDPERKHKKGAEEWERNLWACQGRTCWAWLTTFIEVKVKPSSAPFQFKDGKHFLSETVDGKKSRAQMARYAAELMRRQHRKFVFTVFICRNLVWFMRWDRAGAIVSAPVDYTHNRKPLLNFFYRLAHLDRSDQGYDTSAVLASADQLKLFQDYARQLKEANSPESAYAEHAISDPLRYPVYAVQCNDVAWLKHLDTKMKQFSGSRTFIYLIGKPRSSSLSPTGRGGKGFIAYDVDRKRLVWLKDYWCAEAKGVHSELETYQRLRRHHVTFVATAIAGGDVVQGGERQVTIAQDLLGHVNRPALRFHHRLVLWEIGKPLETYVHGGRLVRAVLHALYGHQQAWEKAGILHRDVSMSNILINVHNGVAFLNDWDLCKYKTELDMTSQAGRSGTWPYMSGTLLEYPLKPNDLADDIESFVYVIWLSLLRFHAHSLSQKDKHGRRRALASHLYVKYQDCNVLQDGFTVGGAAKIEAMLAANPGFKLIMDQNQPEMLVLVAQLARLGKLHYSSLNLTELEYQYGVPQPPQTVDADTTADLEDGTMPNEPEGPEPYVDDNVGNISEWSDEGDPPTSPVHTRDQSTPPTAPAALADEPATPRGPRTMAAHSITPAPHPTATVPDVPPQLRMQSHHPAPGPSRASVTTGSSLSAEELAKLRATIAASADEVTGDFRSHGPIISILTEATKPKRWKDDKIGDQFQGLAVVYLGDPIGSTGSQKRKAAGGDLNPSASQSRSRQTEQSARSLKSIPEPAMETGEPAKDTGDVFSGPSSHV